MGKTMRFADSEFRQAIPSPLFLKGRKRTTNPG